jgi:hypothetical protein
MSLSVLYWAWQSFCLQFIAAQGSYNFVYVFLEPVRPNRLSSLPNNDPLEYNIVV